MSEHILVELTAIIVLGIGAQWLAWRIRLPSILLLLLCGFLIGPISGFLDPNRLLGDLLLPTVSVSVGIILFEGGLTLNVLDLSQIRRVLINLISLGVLVTWAIATLAAYYVVGLDFQLALLLGAILTVSGPTVVLPLLRHVQPVGQVSSILRWEGILVDPVGATLAVIVFEAVTAKQADLSNALVLITMVKTVVIGGVVGWLAARCVVFLLSRHWIPDFLQNPVTLMIVVGVFTLSNLLQEESGLLTTTVMGVLLANQKTVSVKHIIEFKENLRVLLLSSLFILLAARLELAQLLAIDAREIAFLIILVLIARPLAVAASTFGSGLSLRERVFLSWVAPRGIVAAAVTSVFAIQMRDAGFVQADRLVPITFLVIVGTVVIYGLTAGPVSRWLQVSAPHSEGFLIVGAHSWARQIAAVLQSEKIPVILCDTNRGNIAQARLAGLPTYFGNILSPDAGEEMELSGIGRMLALTSNDEVNALAALHFVELFGRAEVYQLPAETQGNGGKELVSHHLRGRFLFAADLNYRQFARRVVSGAIIKKTPLTEEFTYEQFLEMHGRDAIPLFLVGDGGKVTVATADHRVSPKPGQTVIALINPKDNKA